MNKNSGNNNTDKIDLYTLLNIQKDADKDTIVIYPFLKIEKSI